MRCRIVVQTQGRLKAPEPDLLQGSQLDIPVLHLSLPALQESGCRIPLALQLLQLMGSQLKLGFCVCSHNPIGIIVVACISLKGMQEQPRMQTCK